MNRFLNSMVYFGCAAGIASLGACVTLSAAGRGWDALGAVWFIPFVLPTGVVAFGVINILASRVTTERQHYGLSLVIGFLYPIAFGGLSALCDSIQIPSLSLAGMLIVFFVVSLVCEGLLFGVGWLVLYGGKYYREHLAP
jgi:hypothetical protein